MIVYIGVTSEILLVQQCTEFILSLRYDLDVNLGYNKMGQFP